METIKSIKEVYNFSIEPVTGSNGDNGSRLGILQMLSIVTGAYSEYDGYEISTDENQYYVLINNGQSCCENWGYLSSDDNLDYFVGAELIEVKLTDVALNQKVVEESNYYDDGGGITWGDIVDCAGEWLNHKPQGPPYLTAIIEPLLGRILDDVGVPDEHRGGY